MLFCDPRSVCPHCLYFLLLRQKKVTKKRRLWPNRSARPKIAPRCYGSSLLPFMALVLALHSTTICQGQSCQLRSLIWLRNRITTQKGAIIGSSSSLLSSNFPAFFTILQDNVPLTSSGFCGFVRQHVIHFYFYAGLEISQFFRKKNFPCFC